MKNPLVSIIIPVYNSAEFLDKCILSVINQTYSNLEIILVNDGSLDSSGEVCEMYAVIDKRIKTIHKENGGLVSSRKTGILASTGEYVLYIDGDDWIELDIVEEYVEQALKVNADVVVSSHIINLEGRQDVLRNTISPGIYNKADLISKVYPKMLYTGKFSQFGIFSYSWGKLYKRELVLNNQLKVNDFITIGEDALCLYPTLLDAETVVVLEKPGYHYRQRTDSLIKTLKKVEIFKIQAVYDEFKKVFQEKEVLNIMLPQLYQYILSLLIINTGGPVESSTYPFNIVGNVEKIIIYGSGTFGQHTYKKILENMNYNIVAWVDEKHENYSKLKLPVDSLEKITYIEYDAILIAFIDEDNSNKAYFNLVTNGVNQSRIFQIPYSDLKNDIKNLLLEYKLLL